MKKRFLSILMALALALSLLPSAAFAAEGEGDASGAAGGEPTGSETPAARAIEETDVAAIGDEGYETLAAAVAAAAENDTVRLLKETSSERIDIKHDIELDLGGFTLTSAVANSFVVAAGKSLTISNGTLDNTSAAGTAIFGLKGSTVTIESDATIKSYDGIIATNNTADEGYATINVYGKMECDRIAVWGQGPRNTVNLDGAEITADYFAVYQNGSYGGSTYDIKNSTILNGQNGGAAIYISNSKANAENLEQGMQTLNIEGGSITGTAGVEVKYTNVTIEDCTVTATADEPTFDQFNNGSTTTGFAVVATDNSMQPDDPAPEGTVSINGGKYTGLVGLSNLVNIEDYPAFKETNYTITGGEFTCDVSAYVDPNYECVN